MSKFKFYEVGGCIRDEILGVETKDIDFTVVGPSYVELVEYLKDQGFRIYPVPGAADNLTVRAGVPEGHPLRKRVKDADFVLARKDGPTKDGRRPEYVESGTLEDDLRRRDFTVNALARDCDTGEIIDLFGGIEDCRREILRFVGDPYERIKEDGLRVMRAFRFEITKGFILEQETGRALISQVAADMLQCVSLDRIRQELNKMLVHDTPATLQLLSEIPTRIFEAIFRGNLRLMATLKEK